MTAVTQRSPGRGREAPVLVVRVVLLASYGATLAIPLSLTEPASAAQTAALWLVIVLYAVALVGLLWSAVSPTRLPGSLGQWSAPVLVLLCLVLWAPMYAWAQGGQSPWAWLAGLTIAACALAGVRGGLVAAGVLGAAAAVGGALFDRPVLTQVLTTLGCALALWLMCQVLVWLLRLLVAADAERQTQAELAAAQERLRLSRELHDVLGHRLGIIALKAELTAGLARRDPVRAAAEAEAIRTVAAETLAESRRAIHGETAADLAAQLRAAELVLSSAGINTTVDADPADVAEMPDDMSHLLAQVLREAVTNVLRHSDARQVTIALSGGHPGTGPCGILRIMNDGARAPDPAGRPDDSGTGLAALAARCSAAGARLVAGPTAMGTFEVRVDQPPEAVR